jgi:hypothetical protein
MQVVAEDLVVSQVTPQQRQQSHLQIRILVVFH